ncbi:para-nitrobenzyl esterase [Sphingopyxis panaciterrae]|uniref:carboxylesterase family protein n=1 Tax=Sphingopyxis panaciterrae TaxID=363841 RepID=UPI001424129B|nr:carboxylesterase family protein [Sphingopyxis panaciterrae]NIJ37433.1 para-nitrobenzyl esterase [Sphingopyxis panaciterrae]
MAKLETTTVRGICYASAERFGPPVIAPFAPGSTTASRGPVCFQAPSKLAFLTGPQASLDMSEDCLRLSIAIPAGPGPHPVIVWIHGGAYVAGGGDLPWYDGARLAAEQALVVVSISYRLGPFGYLRLPGASGPSNGLLDQMTALRWVRRYIGAFGGDPANVTVVGQSAGAHSIAAMMAWGEARPLFDRAVLMSPPAVPLPSEEATRAVADEYLRSLGVDALSATAGELVSAHSALPPRPITDLRWAPVAPPSGEIVPDAVDIISGWTRDDAGPFALMTMESQAAAHAEGRSMTKLIFERGSRSAAANAKAAGARAWLYRLDFAPTCEFGAGHCIDLPLILGEEEAWRGMPLLGGLSWGRIDAAGRPLRGMIGSFARAGMPAGRTGRSWAMSDRPRSLP